MIKNVQKRSYFPGFYLLLTLFLLATCVSLSFAAEEYPNRPINMIVPYAPASGTDLGSKIMAAKMAEFLGQPLISVYKPGGGGSLGASLRPKQNQMDIRLWLEVLPLMWFPLLLKNLITNWKILFL